MYITMILKLVFMTNILLISYVKCFIPYQLIIFSELEKYSIMKKS